MQNMLATILGITAYIFYCDKKMENAMRILHFLYLITTRIIRSHQTSTFLLELLNHKAFSLQLLP